MNRSIMIITLAGMSIPAGAQSLYETPAPPAAARGTAADDPAVRSGAVAPAVQQVSLYAVEAPLPREIMAEDFITIIISERSKLDRKQKMDSKKEYDNDFEFTEFIDLMQLLELRIEQVDQNRLPEIGVSSDTQFKGDAKYSREDQMTDRITAKVLEVKPNGTLVLEARRSFKSDEEDTVVMLSGMCRKEDVTGNNTVQSNQMYDLVLSVENAGELHRTSRKGMIPRILETIFNF